MQRIKKDDFFQISEEGGVLPLEMPLKSQKKDQGLTIGIPRESIMDEKRIPLTPQGVKMLTANGFKIMIEQNAGHSSHFSDREYSEAGAFITPEKAELYKADMILKIALPTEEEIGFIKQGTIIFSSLNIPNLHQQQLTGLMQKQVTAFAYENIQDSGGILPFMQSMSEIAGKAAVLIASDYLTIFKGEGILMGGITGVPPTEVVILGAGTVGLYAARTALALGADVKVFDNSLQKLRRLNLIHNLNIYNSVIHTDLLTKVLKTADVVIGALHPQNGRTPCVVSEDMVMQMKENAVIIDVSIDHGGCFETSEVTALSNPVYLKHGVIHYCVPNISSAVPQTASNAFNNILVPMLLQFQRCGSLLNYFWDYPYTRHGVFIYKGILTNRFIGTKFNLQSKAIDLLLASNL